MRRGARTIPFAGTLALAAAAAAQPVAVSPRPDAVAVTIYRDPDRPAARQLQLSWLNGFALITETRRVDIPAGDGEIRFEGVAGGILPESAIVRGLPGGVIEKNQDAFLLSPASLLDASLGRRVHLRRTSLATGTVREHEAVVRSSAAGAVVLETLEGLETLRCTGLNETLVYESVPAGLSARPTLSVRIRSEAAASATLTLSYLAFGFDWQANYIANLNSKGDRIDLFAWATLASGDETSFVRADTQAVAGRPNREYAYRPRRYAPPLNLRCWPAGTTTSNLQTFGESGSETITVTGSRIANYSPPPPPAPVAAMSAQQEELGDLKLYRIPEPVTVAAHSQKQVAMLQRRGVKIRQVLRSEIASGQRGPPAAPLRVLVTRNRPAEGLGLPLPAGGVALFGTGGDRPILLGLGSLDDRAVGDEVEIVVGRANGVFAGVTELPKPDRKGNRALLTVTNALDRPVRYEARFRMEVSSDGKPLPRRDGRSVWTKTVPANGTVTLRYGY